MIPSLLHDRIEKVCPILTISFGDLHDKNTWQITFDASATSDQMAAAQAIIDAVDPNAPDPPTVTSEQFIGLLSTVEQAAIVSSPDTGMKLFVIRAMAAGSINLGDPIVGQGIDAAIALGLIASPRKAQILAGQPPQ